MSESPANFGYRAFISYSHKDKAWADWLHKALETYRVPSRLVGTETAHGKIPRRLIPIFRDRDELASAPELGARINDALAQSENLIVICSPASAASRWVDEEVLAYKRMGRGGRVLCLIVAGEPNASDLPGRETEECFCPALRFKLDADGQLTSDPSEPIAADARAGSDGKTNARLKLIAGMLGVGFDALKQRDQHRRLQRMTAITGLAVAVMALTIVLGVFALISRNDAVIAQNQAVVAQHAAQRRQKQAETLVDFMLGNLSDKLFHVGRLSIMNAVDDKAMHYFASLPSTDVNDTALAERAKALERIGTVRSLSSTSASALAAYRASATISSRLAAAEPNNVARQVAYSRTLTFMARIYAEQSRFGDEQKVLATASRVLQPSLVRARNDAALLAQLLYVDNATGQGLQRSGDLVAATVKYREVLELARKLVALQPDKAAYAQALGQAHRNVGDLALQQTDLATAVAEYRAAEAVATRALARDPRNNQQLIYLVHARATLGSTLVLCGDLPAGIRQLQATVKGQAALAKAEPHNLPNQQWLAIYRAELAGPERVSGHLTAAEALSAQALAVFASFAKANPHGDHNQENLAELLVERAQELDARGQHATAIATSQNAVGILRSAITDGVSDLDVRQSLLRARLLLASTGPGHASSPALLQEALQAVQSLPAAKNDPASLALEVHALLVLHRQAGARPMIKRLWDAGYREPGFVALMRRHHIAYPVNPAFKAKLLAATAAAADPIPVPAAIEPTATDAAK